MQEHDQDEGNKAILFSNSRTEYIRVGLQFLQNTKIATSAINESNDDPTRIHTLRKYVGQAEGRTSVETVRAKQ